MNNSKKTLLILSGVNCNNNCIFCSVNRNDKQVDRKSQDIIIDLKKGKEKGFKSVEFTGGEFTIRPDFFDLLQSAKKLGFTNISLSTNGKMFAYKDFCYRAIKSGLSKVTFSLHGAVPQTHNAICRTPESFEQVVSGIKNAKSIGFEVNVSTVICRLNFKEIKKLSEIILDLGVNNWSLLDLIPEGRAEKIYKDLFIDPKDFQSVLDSTKNFLSKGGCLNFFDFPFCFFNKNLIDNSCVKIINTYGRLSTVEQVGYQSERLNEQKDLIIDKIKEKFEFCSVCHYDKVCGGFWVKYLDFFDFNILKKQAIKNKCLKNE